MGSVQCKNCRDDTEKEMEFQPDNNRVAKDEEKENNIKEEYAKNITLSKMHKIVTSDPDIIPDKNKNSGDVTIVSNFAIDKMKSNPSIDLESENMDDEESDDVLSQYGSRISSKNSENIHIVEVEQNSKIQKSSFSQLPREDFHNLEKIDNFVNSENYIRDSKRAIYEKELFDFTKNTTTQNSSKMVTKTTKTGAVLEEKEKNIYYDSNNLKSNPNKMDLINISKIEHVLFNKENEVEFKSDDNYPSKDLKIKVNVNTIQSGNNSNSNFNLCKN
jgi:hypothetical protein